MTGKIGPKSYVAEYSEVRSALRVKRDVSYPRYMYRMVSFLRLLEPKRTQLNQEFSYSSRKSVIDELHYENYVR